MTEIPLREILRVELPFLPKLPNQCKFKTARGFNAHRANLRKEASAFAWLIRQQYQGPVLRRVRAEFVRCARPPAPDDDALPPSFKHLRDQLVAMKVVYDDGPRFLEAAYAWEPAPPREGHVRITVWSMERDVSEEWYQR